MSMLLSRFISCPRNTALLGGTQFLRSKGHSKWQNIRHTKQANDNIKGSMISRYCSIIRFTIANNGQETNPKKNLALAKVIKTALAEGVPKASVEKFINNYGKAAPKEIDYIIRVASSVRIVMISHITNKAMFLSLFSGMLKRYGASLEPNASIKSFFEKKGVLLVKGPSSLEAAEEVAINIEAEEVSQVGDDFYEFITDPNSFPQVRDRFFRDYGSFECLDAEVAYLAIQTSTPSPQEIEVVNKVKSIISERVEVVSVHDNMAIE